MDVVVTGIGLISCLGSLSDTWRSLLAGKSGIREHQLFLELSPLPLGLIGEKPISIDYLTQMVVADALEDAHLKLPLPECGVVIGSSRSYQSAWEYLASNCLNQDLRQNNQHLGLESWMLTLPNRPSVNVASQIGTSASVLAPMAACATGIWAIAQGFELIQQGYCQQVIAGAVESPITPLTLTGFQQMGALAKTGCYPFDKQREGLVLGEGAAVLVLESAELARHRGVSIYGQLLGFGLTCDAYHLNAPEPTAQSAIAAVKQCLARSHLHAQDIDYIHAHGTSTKLNDQREAKLIQELFSANIPTSSTKGATGHTLGASGAIGAALCLLALKNQQLPPNVGLKDSAFDLDLVTVARSADLTRALCLSFGFGGQNAVMALAGSTTK